VTAGHFTVFTPEVDELTITLVNEDHIIEEVRLVGYRNTKRGDVALLRVEDMPAGGPARRTLDRA
jgi:hypothetical protein